MFRLTREVRFAVNHDSSAPAAEPDNAYAGWPALTGLGHYFALAVTVQGELDPRSDYLLNIRDIDHRVRQIALPRVERIIRHAPGQFGPAILLDLFEALRQAWPPARLESLTLHLSPSLSFSVLAREVPMMRLSQKFEFAASHRLHNPALSDDENRAVFGKCNNLHGHGHNYEVQVTITGTALPSVTQLERIVRQAAIDRLDHKNLNVDCPEFAGTIPSVENIARVIYRLLQPQFQSPSSRLACVTVWETPKTCCEYSE